MMSQEEQSEFECNCRNIDWHIELENYVIGLKIWVLKEDSMAPEHNF